MESNEAQELSEHAEHGRRHPGLAWVSLALAVLAVLVAVVSLMGHRAHTEEVLLQAKASDQWAYYQAKTIRRHADETAVDLAALIPAADREAAAKMREKYSGEAERYADEQKEIQKEAQSLESEVARESRKANRFDLGEVFLEVALVVTSITLLTGRVRFARAGMVMALVGLVAAATAFLVS